MSPWLKIDDNALDHPKLLALSDGAFRLWMRGLTYCRRHLTDGLIPHLAVKTFREATKARVEQLSISPEPGMAPLWETCESGYLVHDYLQWNDSREYIENVRTHTRERMTKLRGSARAQPPHNARSAESVRETCATLHNVTEHNVHQPNVPRESTALTRVGRDGRPQPLSQSHRRHAWCGERSCVPDFLHDRFVKSVGGDGADTHLRDFYAKTLDDTPDTQAIESDPLKFWPPLVTARWPPIDAQVSKQTASLQRSSAAFLRGIQRDSR